MRRRLGVWAACVSESSLWVLLFVAISACSGTPPEATHTGPVVDGTAETDVDEMPSARCEAECALTIDLRNVKPVPQPLGESVRVDATQGRASVEFDLSIAATSSPSCPLHYYWYYDYESAAVREDPKLLSLYRTCDDSPTCVVAPCLRLDPFSGVHDLLAVVATEPLRDGASSPLDFTETAEYQTVSWTVTLDAPCR